MAFDTRRSPPGTSHHCGPAQTGPNQQNGFKLRVSGGCPGRLQIPTGAFRFPKENVTMPDKPAIQTPEMADSREFACVARVTEIFKKDLMHEQVLFFLMKVSATGDRGLAAFGRQVWPARAGAWSAKQPVVKVATIPGLRPHQ